jgi:hypothetical protein
MKSKLTLLVLSIVITSFTVCTTLPVAYTSDELTIPIENLSDILNYIRAIETQLTDYEENIVSFNYEIVGEEQIDNIPTWKVEVKFGEEGDETEYTLWVSKSTGETLKAEIEGNVFTGAYAGMFGNSTLVFWLAMTYNYWTFWDYSTIQKLPSEYGIITFLGTDQRSYGPTSLFLYKYRFDGRLAAPEVYRFIVENWIAPTQFGGISAYVYVESIDEQEWFKWELISIELVEPQSIPEVSVGEPEASKLAVKPGEEFDLSVDVSNDGDSFAIYYVPLVVDGELVDSQTIPLEAGESNTVNFKLTIDEEGTYQAEIGGKKVDVTVGTTAPASFKVSDLNISPESVKIGEDVTITVKVTNTGGEKGSYTVTLKIDGEVEDEEAVTLNSAEAKNVSFDVSTSQEGTFDVDVDGLGGSFTVTKSSETEEKPSGGGGIPGFPYESIVLGVILGVIVLWLVQRRE